MKVYHDLLQDILDNGEHRQDRTGVGTLSVFGRQLRFDLRTGFPAITTKRLAWRAVVGELLWFLEGSTDERRLAEITHGQRDGNTTIWTPNAQSPYWKPHARWEGDVGRIYGAQWRDWGGIDQINRLIEGLKSKPHDRRHIISAWNVGELNSMALPPCHILSQYYVNGRNELSCHMYQRSVDTFLGLPFNIASYALLTHMIAQVCDLKVGELIISTGDTHIYLDHLDVVKEQLTREAYAQPVLYLNYDIRNIDLFSMSDIVLDNYIHHGPLKATMAV